MPAIDPNTVATYARVVALAEKGVEGERANAQRAKERMEAKYPGIEDEITVNAHWRIWLFEHPEKIDWTRMSEAELAEAWQLASGRGRKVLAELVRESFANAGEKLKEWIAELFTGESMAKKIRKHEEEEVVKPQGRKKAPTVDEIIDTICGEPDAEEDDEAQGSLVFEDDEEDEDLIVVSFTITRAEATKLAKSGANKLGVRIIDELIAAIEDDDD